MKCIRGDCLRVMAGYDTAGEPRCAEHLKELAETMAAAPKPEPSPPAPKRGVLERLKRPRPTIEFSPLPPAPGRAPLLLRITRGTTLGAVGGRDVRLDPGAVVDLVQAEQAGILTGSNGNNAETMAAALVNSKRAVLLDPGDASRLAPRRRGQQ